MAQGRAFISFRIERPANQFGGLCQKANRMTRKLGRTIFLTDQKSRRKNPPDGSFHHERSTQRAENRHSLQYGTPFTVQQGVLPSGQGTHPAAAASSGVQTFTSPVLQQEASALQAFAQLSDTPAMACGTAFSAAPTVVFSDDWQQVFEFKFQA